MSTRRNRIAAALALLALAAASARAENMKDGIMLSLIHI